MSPPERPAKPRSTRLAAVLRWLLVGCWIALFAATHVPIPATKLPGGDKLSHFAGYAILAFLFGAVLLMQRGRRFSMLGALIILAVYGAFDEFTQSFVGRSSDVYDWLADVVGIVTGLAAAAMIRPILAPRAVAARQKDYTRRGEELSP